MTEIKRYAANRANAGGSATSYDYECLRAGTRAGLIVDLALHD